MPMGIVPIGFTKYGRIAPDCYNCDMGTTDNKCCRQQAKDITTGKAQYTTPDYIFFNDEAVRNQFTNNLTANGLQVNPSI